MTVGFRSFYDPIRGNSHEDQGIKFLCQNLDEGEINMDPPYQRDHVWTKDQQMDFLGFLLEGGRPPEVFFRELPILEDPKPPYYEVVDGKQRITALYRFWRGEIPARLSHHHAYRLVWKKDFDDVELRIAKRTALSVSIQYIRGDDAKIIRIYLKLNSGGTVHTEEDLNRARHALEKAEKK